MAKGPTITTIASGYYSRTALNDNFTNIDQAFENTLSLDGSTPNAMGADLDLNNNDVLNGGNISAKSFTVNGVAIEEVAVSFQDQTQLNVDTAASYLRNGSVFVMSGYSYTLDSTATTAANAPFDGAVPFGEIYIEHWVESGGNNTAQFVSAANYALDGDTINLSPNKKNYTVTASSLPSKRFITWNSNGSRVNSQAIFAGWSGIQVGTNDLGREFRIQNEGQPGDGRQYEQRRNADYTGGLGGTLDFTAKFYNYISATVGSSGQRKAEKAGLFEIEHNSDFANGVALMLNVNANAQGGAWGLEISTQSNVVPTTFAHRGAEIAIEATGADASGLRWALDIPAHGVGGASDSIDRAINIPTGDANYRVGISLNETNGSFKFQDAGIEMYLTDARILDGFVTTGTAVVNIGSDATSGDVTNYISRGGNSTGGRSLMSQVYTQNITNTTGAENANWGVEVMKAGTMTEKLRVSGGSQNILIDIGAGLQVVSRNGVDTAGAGFRALRVPN